MEPKTADLRGLQCPEPLKRTRKELESIDEGVLIVLVNSPANRSVRKFAKKAGMTVETAKHKDHYELKITKTLHSKTPVGGFMEKIIRFIRPGEPCRTVETLPEETKGILLVVGTDTMGKEEDIGRVLMKGFFETMKVTGELPHTIFFLNAGVRLTTTETEVIPILKDIESMGVEIYSCGTCLKHFDLESELKVGHRGMTNHIVEGIKDFKKVVWI